MEDLLSPAAGEPGAEGMGKRKSHPGWHEGIKKVEKNLE
jgi:hypothetical protein